MDAREATRAALFIDRNVRQPLKLGHEFGQFLFNLLQAPGKHPRQPPIPTVIRRFDELGTEARFTTPEAFFELMRTQADTWIPVIRKANLKLE